MDSVYPGLLVAEIAESLLELQAGYSMKLLLLSAFEFTPLGLWRLSLSQLRSSQETHFRFCSLKAQQWSV